MKKSTNVLSKMVESIDNLILLTQLQNTQYWMLIFKTIMINRECVCKSGLPDNSHNGLD